MKPLSGYLPSHFLETVVRRYLTLRRLEDTDNQEFLASRIIEDEEKSIEDFNELFLYTIYTLIYDAIGFTPADCYNSGKVKFWRNGAAAYITVKIRYNLTPTARYMIPRRPHHTQRTTLRPIRDAHIARIKDSVPDCRSYQTSPTKNAPIQGRKFLSNLSDKKRP